MGQSIVLLPRNPMRPRYADERVGYFVSAFKDFSRDTAKSFFVRYVNRWRLECSEQREASCSTGTSSRIYPQEPHWRHWKSRLNKHGGPALQRGCWQTCGNFSSCWIELDSAVGT